MNLIVIFGAGASVDVVPAGSTFVSDRRFPPPVTATIFNTHNDWERYYNLFPGVEGVLQQLRTSSKSGVSLEKFLSGLKSSENEYERKQFIQFPIYLQYYFSWISGNYCHSPANYSLLLNKTLSRKIDKVAYVTTNYDLFFDKALERHPHTSPVFSSTKLNMTKYDSQDKWKFFKVHGSVDWGRVIKADKLIDKGDTISSMINNVQNLGDELEGALSDEIIIDVKHSEQTGRRMIYPALSVPTGESKFNMPSEHLTSLKKSLDQSTHFLILGFSGYDKDILDLLSKKGGDFRKILVVSRSQDSGENTKSTILAHEGLSKLKDEIEVWPGNGFNEFMSDPSGLDSFLTQITAT